MVRVGFRAVTLIQGSIRRDRIDDPVDRAILIQIHVQVAMDLRLALSTMLTEDRRSARELIDAKRQLNELERTVSRDHLARLSGQDAAGLGASTSFLAVLRDLKLVNSDFAGIGYAVVDPPERSRSQQPEISASETNEKPMG